MGRRLLTAWRRYWFEPASLVDLGIARLVIAAIFLVLDPRTRYLRVAAIPPALWAPLPIVAALPQPDLVLLVWLGRATAVLLVALALGIFTRPALVLLLPLILVQEAWLNSAGKITHGTIPVTWALAFLVLAPCNRRFALDALWRRPAPRESRYARWPIELTFVAVAAFYCLAGVAKLRTAGLAWADGWTLQYELLTGTPTGIWVAQSRMLCAVLSVLVLTFEVGAPLGVIRRLRPLVLAGGVAFHLGTTLLMRITFWPVVALFLVFVPWQASRRR
jgi:hypothetical protein